MAWRVTYGECSGDSNSIQYARLDRHNYLQSFPDFQLQANSCVVAYGNHSPCVLCTVGQDFRTNVAHVWIHARFFATAYGYAETHTASPDVFGQRLISAAKIKVIITEQLLQGRARSESVVKTNSFQPRTPEPGVFLLSDSLWDPPQLLPSGRAGDDDII
eukprot:951862-Pleurochrysis_carterae.AAC.1